MGTAKNSYLLVDSELLHWRSGRGNRKYVCTLWSVFWHAVATAWLRIVASTREATEAMDGRACGACWRDIRIVAS